MSSNPRTHHVDNFLFRDTETFLNNIILMNLFIVETFCSKVFKYLSLNFE